MTGARPRSGEQIELEAGELRAVIATVGASLRALRARDQDLVVPFAPDEARPAYRGATIAPWPNRVIGGCYEFDGARYELPRNEAERGHALHGLTPWLDFQRATERATERVSEHPGEGERAGSAVTLRATVEPQRGYPWRIAIRTRFALDHAGLTQTVSATNLSDRAAPYGVCPHPYLVAGEGPLDTWTLEFPAAQVLEAEEGSLAPLELAPVEVDRARFDFRSARPIGAAKIDHAFTGLQRGPEGTARLELRAPDGAGVAMSWDASCDWVQLYTADDPAAPPGGDRLGLAVEPMTCAPDAFNGGAARGLVRLAPGATHTASWRIEPIFRSGSAEPA